MGYMGFGMRKEVYTRKPKEAFKRLKQIHGETPKKEKGLKDSEYLELKQHRKSGFRHFYQSRVFMFLLSVLITVALFGLLWQFILSNYYLDYQRSQFEQSGINDYYESKRLQLATIQPFFSKRRNKLKSVYNGFLEHQTIKIKSADVRHSYNIDSIRRVKFNTDWTDKKCTINQNNLNVSGKGFISTTYPDKWILDILISNSNPINSSTLKYLETDWNELERILHILKENDWTISTHENYISIHYEHPLFENYNIIFADYLPQEISKQWNIKGYIMKSGIILKGEVYWTRLEKLPKS
ncbi:hypothetical protein FNH22_10950 [Fulvivirga sp. M361]|uniref:hypothetical protein n=1 Tax=Fulvivirga sp. M361 TaxID=2594266 RepID=UPI00117A13AF|nr:hypothetical protein [Fulvivirga sp. M361]TRX59039.1 hypothetical protein FNH22_10950 [Fulvivirga sp. M361]